MANIAFENTGIEQVREYWNSRPCNIRHSLKEIGTKEYFDQVEARSKKLPKHADPFKPFTDTIANIVAAVVALR